MLAHNRIYVLSRQQSGQTNQLRSEPETRASDTDLAASISQTVARTPCKDKLFQHNYLMVYFVHTFSANSKTAPGWSNRRQASLGKGKALLIRQEYQGQGWQNMVTLSLLGFLRMECTKDTTSRVINQTSKAVSHRLMRLVCTGLLLCRAQRIAEQPLSFCRSKIHVHK